MIDIFPNILGLCGIRQAVGSEFCRQQPLFPDPGFFRSPLKPFKLPCYVESLALEQAENLSPVQRERRLYDPRVLKYVDDIAIESSGSDSL